MTKSVGQITQQKKRKKKKKRKIDFNSHTWLMKGTRLARVLVYTVIIHDKGASVLSISASELLTSNILNSRIYERETCKPIATALCTGHHLHIHLTSSAKNPNNYNQNLVGITKESIIKNLTLHLRDRVASDNSQSNKNKNALHVSVTVPVHSPVCKYPFLSPAFHIKPCAFKPLSKHS